MAGKTAKSRGADEGGRWMKVYCRLIRHPAYRTLSRAGKQLMWDLKSQLNGSNNGTITAPLSVMRRDYGWTSAETLANALYELRAMGFIAVTKAGGFKEGTRVCSTYRFTDQPVYDQPKHGIQAIGATNDFEKIETLADAKALMESRIEAMREDGRAKQKKSPVRKSNRTSSEIEPEEKNSGSISEHGAHRSGSIIELWKKTG